MNRSKLVSKRHPSLKDLSRDHRKILKQAKAVQWSANSDCRAQQLADVLKAFQTLWTTQIQLHVRQEEEILIPFCLRHDGSFQPLSRQMLTDHGWLRDHFDQLSPDTPELVAAFGHKLREHIRFEERMVFEHIQAMLPASELSALGVQLRQFRLLHRPPRRKKAQNNGT
jgi:hemerythrin-like domain-containing protein